MESTNKKSNALLILTISVGVVFIVLLAFIAFKLLDKSKSGENSEPKTTTSVTKDSAKTTGNPSSGTTTNTTTPEKKNNPVITANEAITFVNKWAGYQSAINISAYTSCYSPEFRGVKRTKSGREYTYDYAGWISDRTKMYAKQKYIVLTADNITLTKYDANTRVAEVNFWQTYKTKSYSDEGKKFLHLKKDANGEIRIVYEELLYSIPEGVTEGD